MGSEYLYEELFPGLNETNAPTVGQKSRSLVSATKPDKSRLPGHPSSFETPKSCTKNQTSFPNNFPQKAHHSNNTANSNKTTSENTINQSSFPSLKDSIPNKATTSKTSFQQIHLSRNQVAVQSTMKSTSLSSGLSVKGNGNGYKMSHSVTPIVPCVEPIPKAKTKKSLGDCEKKCGKVHATTQPLIPKPTSEDKPKQSKNTDTSTGCLVEAKTKSHVNDESKPTKSQAPTQLPPKSSSETRKSPSETRQSTSETRKSPSETRRSTSETRKSTSETRKSPSETRQSPSETRKSTSETRQSTSETRKFPSETRKSPSETRKSTSETRKSTSETRQSQNINKKRSSYTPTDLFENDHCPPKSATESATVTGVTDLADIKVTSLQDTTGTESIDHHNIPAKSTELSKFGYPSQLSIDSSENENIERSNVQHQSTQQPGTSISDSSMSNSITCKEHSTMSQDDRQSVLLPSLVEENSQMLITSSISIQALAEDCFNNHELIQPLSDTTGSDNSNISNTEALAARMSNTTDTAKDRVADNDCKTNRSSSQTCAHDSEKQPPKTDDGSILFGDTCSVVDVFTELSGKDDTSSDCSAMSLNIDEQSNQPPRTFGASAKLLSDLYHESIQTPGQFTFEDRNEASTEPLNTVDRSIQQQENTDINEEREPANDHATTSHLDTINSSLVSNCNLLSSHIGGTLDTNPCEKPSIVPKLNQDTNEERNCKDEQTKPIEEAGLVENLDSEEVRLRQGFH